MGRSYGYTASGRQARSCDNCGTVGGVRQSSCTEKVRPDTLHGGNRTAIPYCPGAGLCSPCLKKLGGRKGLHKNCVAPAAASQAEYDATQARIDAGEKFVVSASGDWKDNVPEGHVEITFAGANYSGRENLIVPTKLYDNNRVKKTLAEYRALIAA